VLKQPTQLLTFVEVQTFRELKLRLPVDESDEQIAQDGFGDIIDGELHIKCELVRQLLVRKILKPTRIAESP